MKSSALLVVSLLVPLLGADAASLLKPYNKVESWRMEQIEGGAGEIRVDGENLVLTSKTVTATDWHVQATMSGLVLKEGKTYVLKFKAKAEKPCTIGLNVMIDEEDWHSIGLNEQLFVAKEFGEQSFVFTAENVSKDKNRISFVLGHEKCSVTVKDLTLTEK